MGYSAGKISPPVSIYDVQQPCWVRLKRTVGGQVQTVYSSDLGVLCSASVGDIIPARDGNGNWTVDARGEINMWARYKPERAAGPKPLIHGQSPRSRKGNNFGLQVAYCNENLTKGWRLDVMNGLVYDLVYVSGTEDEGWRYLPPRGDMSHAAAGGVEEFYRLTDFVRLPTDDTDPYYNTVYAKGYNHLAKIPFQVFMDMAGVTEREDASLDLHKYYEINLQVTNALTLTFFNSMGDDLHLQDFIDIASPDAQGRAWRPVLQVFDGYKPAGGEDWWNRSQPDIETAGGVITANTGDSWSVSLDLTDSHFAPFIGANEVFHLCVGVGFVNSDFSSWGSGSNQLFLVPYSKEQYDNVDLPFYYQFKIVSYQSRKIYITQLQFFQSLTTWVIASKSESVFTINSEASDLIRVVFTITKEQNQSLEFIGQNGTVQSQSNSPLKVQVREMINYVETIKYLTPRTSSWQTPSSNPVVPTGQTSETVTLYADFYMGDIGVGEYAQYHICAYTGAMESGQEKYDNIGSFSIYKEQYHN